MPTRKLYLDDDDDEEDFVFERVATVQDVNESKEDEPVPVMAIKDEPPAKDSTEVVKSSPDKTKNKKRKKTLPDAVFNLGAKRKVTVGFYEGKMYVNIREYYKDKDSGEERPSKRGIALTPAQWQTLTEQVELISEAVFERTPSSP